MLKKTVLSTTLATIAVFAAVTFNSCKKTSCYDAGMAKAHSGICTMDCPGVTACNGKFYCNACEANKAGYRVDQ